MRLALTVAVGLFALPASAADITGAASVIDGDTIEIHGQRIRLHGIDAPEAAQTCWTEHGHPYGCGAAAKQYLVYLTGGDDVTCGADAPDRGGPRLGTCRARGVDLNAAMVRAGWALADRRHGTAYVDDEGQARQAGAGMWAGSFVPPWEWRRKPEER